MLQTATRTTDAKARVSLPKRFANSTVLVEQISDTELRIRKARVVPEDEFKFEEEMRCALSPEDQALFLKLLKNPPPPNKALKRLMTNPKKLIELTAILTSKLEVKKKPERSKHKSE